MATVLGILGSFRRNGNSAWLLREALEGAREVEGTQAELVPLAELSAQLKQIVTESPLAPSEQVSP